MYSEAEVQEYLTEIRERVCSRCVERVPGGPPCGLNGKTCGVELHLAQFLQTVHKVESPLVGPYLDKIHDEVCTHCPRNGQEGCPCPLDYLLVLIVDAIEAVDRRRCDQPARNCSGASETTAS